MQTSRFYTGVVMVLSLLMAICLALSPGEATPNGPIEGTVTYRGRPVHGGTIFFRRSDGVMADDMNAAIDESGYFRVDPSWRRDCSNGQSFRIYVVLDLVEYAELDRTTADATASRVTARDMPTRGRSHLLSRPTRRVIRASSETPSRPAEQRWVTWVRQHRFSDPRTTNLFARLDNGPARVDISLRD